MARNHLPALKVIMAMGSGFLNKRSRRMKTSKYQEPGNFSISPFSSSACGIPPMKLSLILVYMIVWWKMNCVWASQYWKLWMVNCFARTFDINQNNATHTSRKIKSIRSRWFNCDQLMKLVCEFPGTWMIFSWTPGLPSASSHGYLAFSQSMKCLGYATFAPPALWPRVTDPPRKDNGGALFAPNFLDVWMETLGVTADRSGLLEHTLSEIVQ